MVIGRAASLSTPEYFDVADCLAKRIQEQEAACMIDEPVNDYHESNDPDPLPFWINPSPSSPLPPPPPPRRVHTGPPTSMDYKKKSSKLRRKRKREEVQSKDGTPSVKAFHLEHRDKALHAAIQVDVDINALPHSEPAYTAGGLFRFILNGFKTDHVFELTTTKEEKREQAEEAKTRWQEDFLLIFAMDFDGLRARMHIRGIAKASAEKFGDQSDVTKYIPSTLPFMQDSPIFF
ncbi:hypothetical protein B0H13DRAFT_1905414 [Mycena leptocephala]|nr:hypothetical protein B0H13DRAFT_1905414 [Mycena leptocephala]